jgi:hypothetical protein
MMEVINCEQGTAEWFAARCGIVTASEFQTLLMKGKGGGVSLTRQTYMRKLAGEIITGEPSEGFSNTNTERGKAMEPEARDLYAFMADCEPQQVGFIKSGRKGASPDSLIGDKGGLEIKTRLPHLMIELLEKDEVPPEHIAQIQGGMWVGEREWWDFVAYWPKLPLFVKRVYRDEAYIKTLASAVNQFNEELDALVSRIRSYGMKEAA